MGFLDSIFGRKPPTPDQFADIFVKEARKQGLDREMSYDAAEFRFKLGDGAVFNLHNAYRAYNGTKGAERDRAMSSFIAALADLGQETPQDFARIRSQLRPVIRSRSVLEHMRLHEIRLKGTDENFRTAFLPFGEDCVVLLAVDRPESISTLTGGPEEAWNLSFDDAIAIAIDNLRDTPDQFTELATGLYYGAWRDSYDTSRALLPDMLERLPVRGRPIFMMPTRDVLLVTGDHDTQGLISMTGFAEQALNEGRTVSASMFSYTDGKVYAYKPEDPLIARQLAHLGRLLDKEEYDSQKAVLDQIHEEQGKDIFVANYALFAKEGEPGTSFSVASWTRGVDTSLPKVDRLALVRPEAQDEMGEVRVVAWEQAMPYLDHLLEPEAGFPARYRTRGFPEDALLAKLDPIP